MELTGLIPDFDIFLFAGKLPEVRPIPNHMVHLELSAVQFAAEQILILSITSVVMVDNLDVEDFVANLVRIPAVLNLCNDYVLKYKMNAEFFSSLHVYFPCIL